MTRPFNRNRIVCFHASRKQAAALTVKPRALSDDLRAGRVGTETDAHCLSAAQPLPSPPTPAAQGWACATPTCPTPPTPSHREGQRSLGREMRAAHGVPHQTRRGCHTPPWQADSGALLCAWAGLHQKDGSWGGGGGGGRSQGRGMNSGTRDRCARPAL